MARDLQRFISLSREFTPLSVNCILCCLQIFMVKYKEFILTLTTRLYQYIIYIMLILCQNLVKHCRFLSAINFLAN